VNHASSTWGALVSLGARRVSRQPGRGCKSPDPQGRPARVRRSSRTRRRAVRAACEEARPRPLPSAYHWREELR
jgi:hypothetical protein